MRRSVEPLHVAGVILVGLLVAASCSSEERGGGTRATTPTSAPDSSTAGIDFGGGTGIADVEVDPADEAAVEAARNHLASPDRGLSAELLHELVLQGVDHSPNVSHVRFGQAHDGHLVVDTSIVVHVLSDLTVQAVTNTLTVARPLDSAVLNLGAEDAIERALKAVDGTATGEPAATAIWIEEAGVLELAWEVTVSTVDPVALWLVTIDAVEGELIATSTQRPEKLRDRRRTIATIGAPDQTGSGPRGSGVDACDLPAAPSACIFAPDPIYASGGSLDRRSEIGEANDHLRGVTLEGLDDPGSGELKGEFVDAAPSIAPVAPVPEDDGTWATGRGRPGFEEAMAYYWIDTAQRTVQNLGFNDLLAEPFPVVALATDVVDNAFYDPGNGVISLGLGSDGINEAEDATGILHEYGHALLDAQQPRLLDGGDAGAYHEGWADAFAFLATLELRTGNDDVDAACLFAWPEDLSCLRRVDEDLVYPDDLSQQVHADGRIWSGAVYDVLEALLGEVGLSVSDCPGASGETLSSCTEVRDRVLATNLAANSYLAPDIRLPDAGAAFVLANDAMFDGDDEALIREALAAHGLDDGATVVGGGGGSDPASELPRPGSDAVFVEIDVEHSFRGDLTLTLGVVDADGEALCEEVLAEPDDADDANRYSGSLDVSDLSCARFVPPSPDQQWLLGVVDDLRGDAGEIRAFTVIVDSATYRSADLPLPIPDANPDGVFAVVNGTDTSSQPGQSDPVDPDTMEVGSPRLELAISHELIGDLQVIVTVSDGKGEVLCSVPVLDPDPTDVRTEVAGAIDVAECAELSPPSADRVWAVRVVDSAGLDVGTVDGLRFIDASGETLEAAGLPAAIPDDDPSGVELSFDGSGTSGSGGVVAGDGLLVRLEISHSYRGDLGVTAGIADDDGVVLCEETGASPDREDDGVDLTVEIDLSRCAARHGAREGVVWYAQVSDTLEEDMGTVELAELKLPGGDVIVPSGGLPVPIPDADPGGVLLVFDPSLGTIVPSGEAAATLALDVRHPYRGDLTVVAGVRSADGRGEALCEVAAVESDELDDGVNLHMSIDLSVCAELALGRDVRWFVSVVDELPDDVGFVASARLVLADGTELRPASETPLPQRIPDASPSGVVVVFDR